MPTNRVKYLDYLKGLGIALVVLNHMGMSSHNLEKYIDSFHMPLFFFAAGVTIEYSIKYTRKIFCTKKIKRLLGAWLIFGIWGMIFSGLEGSKVFLHIRLDDYNPPIWFLPALFIMYLIFYEASQHITRIGFRILFFLILSVGSTLIPASVNQAANVKSALVFIGFMALGNYFGEHQKEFFERMKSYQGYIWGAGFIITGFITAFLNGRVSAQGAYGSNIVLCYGSAVCSILGWIIFSKKLSEMQCKILDIAGWFGKNSVIILGTHWSVFVWVTHLLKVYFPELNRTIVKFPIVMLMEVVIIFCVNEIKILAKKRRKY